MSSFWSNNPHVASWISSVTAWWRGDPPRLLVIEKSPLQQQAIPGVDVRQATFEDLNWLPEFWFHWFSLSSRCKSKLPLTLVKEAFVGKRWEVFIALRQDTGQLIGTLVCRKIEQLKIDGAVWPQAAVVDYFCVHPAWRSKGVGRSLLTLLHNTRKTPMPPHLMFWEQAIQLKLPCFSSGIFWLRECQPSVSTDWQAITDPADRERLWTACIPKGSVEARGGWAETTVYRGLEGSVAIWNTFHTTVPEGFSVAIVLGATSEEALNAFCRKGAGGFGILLRPANAIAPPSDQWQFDSVYAWFAYNTLLGSGPGLGTFPCLAL